MDLTSLIVGGVIGVVLPPLFAYFLAKINPNKAAELVAKFLSKIVKDERARNKIENQIGEKLIEIGKAIIQYTPDE